MKIRPYKRSALLTSALLLLGMSLACFVWVRKEQRQYALDRALIAALVKGDTKFSPLLESDTKRAIALVEAGADPNTRYSPTPSPSLYEFLNRFLRHSQPRRSNHNPTALMIACSFYLQLGEDIRINEEKPQLGQELTQVMLLHGASVNTQDTEGQTALCWAIGGGNREVIQQLLDYGADPNGADVAYYTDDRPSIVYRIPEIVALLRKYRKHP